MRSEFKPRVTFSTDVGGIMADPKSVLDLVHEAGWNTAGLEIVGIFTQTQILHDIVRGKLVPEYRIDGVHGRLGASESPTQHDKGVLDWLLIKVADGLIRAGVEAEFRPRDLMLSNMILDFSMTLELVASILNNPIYYNVHNREIANNLSKYSDVVVPTFKYANLTIENGPCDGDVSETKKLVQIMREKHEYDVDPIVVVTTGHKGKVEMIPVKRHIGGTFDFAHALVELEHGGMPDIAAATKHWSRVLSVFDSKIFDQAHIPIGLKSSDSLPISDLLKEKSMLKDMVAILLESGTNVTFENQHSLIFGAKNRKDEVLRLRRIREGFLDAGFPEY